MSLAAGFTVKFLRTAAGQSVRDFGMLAPEWQKLINEKKKTTQPNTNNPLKKPNKQTPKTLEQQVLSQKMLAFRVRN